ncbi:hypothetical protein [Streptomyces sp. NPDC058045]|uniref:hypothetical protein n=1 Tax=Streptomyces sp. NPDC058045 TaxID=3346311 RepID=UPI0036E5E29E
MRNELLPEREIEVQQIQVRAYQRAGWRVVGDDGTPVETTAAAKGRRLKKED